MKGTIHKCAEKLIIEKFGVEKWEELLQAIGLDEFHTFLINDDVDEGLTRELFQKAPAILGITDQQLLDAFGEYWVHTYAPKVYPAYYEGVKSTKDFLLKLDTLHAEITDNIENARPPRFGYKWLDENTLQMDYSSSRGMLPLFISLAKGLQSYYKDEMKIESVDNANSIQFSFA